MSESKSESRVIDCFGPNFLIETNGPVGVAGPVTYQMYAVTDKGAKWQQALHGSGLATMESDHTLEIQTGIKNKEGQISYMLMAHNGDLAMTTENGWVRIHGQNIVLDASNEILLQGAKVTVGNADGSTETMELYGKKIHLDADQEIVVKRSNRIGRVGGQIILKSARSNRFSMAGVQAAFIPRFLASRLRPGEFTGGMG
tara:strand:- start:98 stop:697 length:600 start_codon:yes stop_codon:yes gene_type:complete